MNRVARRWIGPSLLVALGIAILVSEAAPRIGDGARSIRQAHHAMHDESVILERTWEMVERGDLHHKVGVYPGFYPYTVALIRWLAGDASTKTTIRATRWVSMATMIVALIVTFILFSLVADNPWVGGLLATAMAIQPEVILWSCRVHPDAFALLFTNASLAFLGLSTSSERRRELVFATVFAGLSAGTKLHGVFIMPVVAGLLIYRHKSDRKELLKELLRHAAIFTGVFVLCSPNLLRFPRGIILGFMDIQTDNAASSGSPLDWFPVLVSPGGLGWTGTLLALIGLGAVAVRRRVDAPTIISAFAIVYLSFLIATIRMVEARYAFPAMWPLLFVGLSAVVPRSTAERPKLAALALAVLLFFKLDRPRQNQALAEFSTFFEHALNAPKLDLAQKLRVLQKTNPGLVITSPYLYVPEGIEWEFLWSLDDVPFPTNAAVVVVDHYLRTTRPGPNLKALLSGERGFVATATISDFVIYENRSRSRRPAR